MAAAQGQFRAQSVWGQLSTQSIQFHQGQSRSPYVPVAMMVTKTERHNTQVSRSSRTTRRPLRVMTHHDIHTLPSPFPSKNL